MDACFEKLHEEIKSVTSNMTADQLTFHLEGKWNTVEVLEHLSLTYRATIKGMEKCLQEDKPLAGERSMRHWVRRTIVVGLGYMPTGRQAPERARPRGAPMEEVLKGIGPELAKMDNAIRRCEARFGGRLAILNHPIFGPLTAGQWRRFHSVHGHHHVKQIRTLREAFNKRKS